MKTMHKALEKIKHGTFTFENKDFKSPVKFLDYVVKTRTHEYFPHKEVHKIQNKVIQQEKGRFFPKDWMGQNYRFLP